MGKADERIQALEAKLKQLKVQHQRKEARAVGTELAVRAAVKPLRCAVHASRKPDTVLAQASG